MTSQPNDIVPSLPPRSRRVRLPRVLSGICIALIALLSLPLAYLIVRSGDGGWRGALEVLIQRSTAVLVFRSVGLAAAVTVSSVLLGTPLAWLTARTDLPARRLLTLMLALPLVVPSYLAAYSFIGAFGPRGALQQILAPLGVGRLPEIYGAFGAWVVLTLFTYPYVFLSVRSAIAGIDPALEEAAATLSSSRREALMKVVVPQLRPAMAVGGLMVALYTLHDFGAVSLMRFDTFTRAIYQQYQGSFDRTAAAMLSLVLILIAMSVLYLEVRSRGRRGYFPVHTGGRRRPRTYRLGKWKIPSLLAAISTSALALGVPLGTIGYWLMLAVSSGAPSSITIGSALNSIKASALGAFLCLLASIPLAALAVRYEGKLSRLVERAIFIGYALPGLVVALSLVFFGARVVRPLYQTLAMLGFAYVVLFLPLAVGSVRSSMLQVSPRLEDAAMTLGSSRLGSFIRITLPALRPGLLGGAALVFLTAMKELPATLLLAPIGFRTLATQVWGATSGSAFTTAALPAFTLIVLSSVPLSFLVVGGFSRQDLPPS